MSLRKATSQETDELLWMIMRYATLLLLGALKIITKTLPDLPESTQQEIEKFSTPSLTHSLDDRDKP